MEYFVARPLSTLPEVLKYFFKTRCIFEQVCYLIGFILWYKTHCTDLMHLLNINTFLFTPCLYRTISEMLNHISGNRSPRFSLVARNSIENFKILQWLNVLSGKIIHHWIVLTFILKEDKHLRLLLS